MTENDRFCDRSSSRPGPVRCIVLHHLAHRRCVASLVFRERRRRGISRAGASPLAARSSIRSRPRLRYSVFKERSVLWSAGNKRIPIRPLPTHSPYTLTTSDLTKYWQNFAEFSPARRNSRGRNQLPPEKIFRRVFAPAIPASARCTPPSAY